MELLAELAMRFPKGDNGDGDKLRIRLLAEDLSETMTPAALTAAIKEGRKTWKFLPTLAEIIEAAAPYRAEQRDKDRAAEQRIAIERARAERALPATTFDTSAVLAEMRAKIDASTATLLGHVETEPAEPLTWKLLREQGRAISPKLAAMMAERAN